MSSHHVDLEKLQERLHVRDVSEIVGLWEFRIEGMSEPLQVKVQRYFDGSYVGSTNFAIKNPYQAAPYQSLAKKASVQEAVEDALDGFLLYWHPKDADKTELIRNKNF
jgi:hypothetical protein